MHLQELPGFWRAGGKTCRVASVFLEKPFWILLEQMALDTGFAPPQLISCIDEAFRAGDGNRATPPLSSCPRVACPRWPATQVRATASVKAAGRKASVLQTLLDETGDCSQFGILNRTPTNDQIR